MDWKPRSTQYFWEHSWKLVACIDDVGCRMCIHQYEQIWWHGNFVMRCHDESVKVQFILNAFKNKLMPLLITVKGVLRYILHRKKFLMPNKKIGSLSPFFVILFSSLIIKIIIVQISKNRINHEFWNQNNFHRWITTLILPLHWPQGSIRRYPMLVNFSLT